MKKILIAVSALAFAFANVSMGQSLLAATEYTITYDAMGGAVEGSNVQSFTGGNYTLPNVTRDGYNSPIWKDSSDNLDYPRDGTPIRTAEELRNMNSSGTYYLECSISLVGENWEPKSFSGILDGRGYTIFNANITSNSSYVGFFSTLSGTIKNVNFVNLSVSSSYSSSTTSYTRYVGGIAGQMSSSSANITNCAITSGSISASLSLTYENSGTMGSYLYVGGLVGYGYGTITNSYNLASVTGTSTANSTYTATGYNSNSYLYIGGIIGYNNSTITIQNCFNSGKVTCNSNAYSSGYHGNAYGYAGGILGYSGSTTNIYYCYNTAEIATNINGQYRGSSSYSGYAYSYAGGIIGYGYGTLKACYNSGYINGDTDGRGYYGYGYAYSGGICGYSNSTITMTSCHNLANVRAYGYGRYYSSNTHATNYRYCYAYAGGLVGYRGSTVKTTNGYNGGSITATGSTSNAGDYKFYAYQLVGYTSNGTYSNNYYNSGATVSGSSGKGTNGATATTDVASMANLQYSGIDNSTYKANWNSNSGTTYATLNILQEKYYSGVPGETFPVDNINHSYQAVWVPNNYTITYDGNGATNGSTYSSYHVFSQPKTLNKNNYTMAGYSFAGWSTEADATTVLFLDGQVVLNLTTVENGQVILYAIWQSTINLDLQGGVGVTSVTATYNAPMPELAVPLRSGYAFGGYFAGKNGTATRYYTNTMNSACINNLPNGSTLYAYWIINSYVIIFNPNGGSVSSTEMSVEFGDNVVPPTPTRTGYTFFGWFIDGERYSGGIWTYTENKIATAKWGYTLTYDANGGWVERGSIVVSDGDVITNPVPNRDGCLFEGWKIGSNIYNGGLWTFTSNQIAVAQWSCKLLSTLNNGAEGSISGTQNGKYAPGTTVTITANPASGYAFAYWMINSAKYTSATYSAQLNEHTTAVAYFTKTQPTANVYASGGSIANTYLNFEPETYSATLKITPEAGKYIKTLSFDNVAFYTIDSWASTLYADSAFAQNVSYRANEGNNNLWLTFNYYDTTKSVNVYVTLTTEKYTDLNMPPTTSGTLDGIAVTANYGGSVTLVGADYEALADSDEIICTAKLAQPGYEFVGWCFADNQSNILSTSESAKFKKSTIYGKQLLAKFKPTDDNPNYNMDLDNL